MKFNSLEINFVIPLYTFGSMEICVTMLAILFSKCSSKRSGMSFSSTLSALIYLANTPQSFRCNVKIYENSIITHLWQHILSRHNNFNGETLYNFLICIPASGITWGIPKISSFRRDDSLFFISIATCLALFSLSIKASGRIWSRNWCVVTRWVTCN